MSAVMVQPRSTRRYELLTEKLARVYGSAGVVLPLFFGAHVLLALLMDRYRIVGSLHALATLMVGLWFAVWSRRSIEQVAYIGAYITGSEVLWRMSEAAVFWEMGKYATTAIFLAAILRSRNWKAPSLPFIYFLLLLPSVALTLMKEDLSDARLMISGNMSGPLSLMISAWFFSRLTLSIAQLRRLFLVAIGPTIGVAAIAASSTITTSDIAFGNESNFITSGGFGPNQVSAALGLGALLALLYLLTDKGSWIVRVLMVCVTLGLAIQSALTFSRGGLYTAAGGAAVAVVYLSKDARARVKILVLSAVLLVIAIFVLLPNLDAFTGGALSARFQNTSSTGREQIAQADLHIWNENPFFGVGPGESKIEHALYYRRIATHTEYTRLLAEHGLFGLAAGLMLFLMAAQRFVSIRRINNIRAKALLGPMVIWSLLYMVDKAMRLVAPSFAFGLCFITIRQWRVIVRSFRIEENGEIVKPKAIGMAGSDS
jgi:O-antigen ligase